MPPTWNAQNLTQHHQKRITQDAGCFEDLLGLGQPMTEAEYDQRSQDAVTNAWAKYQGQGQQRCRRGLLSFGHVFR